VLGVNRDVYYGLYMLFVGVLCVSWARQTRVDARATVLRNWRWGVALGAVFAAVTSLMVIRTEDATPHPDGLAFVGAIVWRGILYGLTDGVLLSVFPILVVFAAFRGKRRLGGRVGVGALALAASLLLTAVYHVGYSDFRGEKLRKPLVGDLVWSVPTLLTLSPVGSPIAHAGLHVSAVVHSYDTKTFLPPHAGTSATRPDLQGILEGITSGRRKLAPGATAYVTWPGGHWSGAAGVVNVKTGVPMQPDARMRLESVSKIWTATLVLQLVAEGKLKVIDTVERWLPGVFPFGNRITILQLLTHTSGMFDDNDAYNNPRRTLARIHDPVLRAQFVAIAKRFSANPRITFSPLFLVKLAATQPLYFKPGSGYHYSNIGFDLLGLIVGRITGKPVGQVFEERIFRPLGLKQTAFDPQGPIQGQHPRGYTVEPSGRLADMTDAHAGKFTDGGIVSNAAEAAQFLVGLIQGKLLPQPILRGMQSYAFWNGGWQTPCGVTVYGHSGAGSAFKADVLTNGDGSSVAVLLLNGRGDNTMDIRAGEAATQLFCAAPR
jgi:D-alanyl-D-alanine carboxypeptidase